MLARTFRNVSLAAVIFWSLALNFGWFAVRKNFSSPDSPTYLVPAANLAAGRGYEGYQRRIYSAADKAPNWIGPETFRTPAYPLFLAPFVRWRIPLATVVALQHLFVGAVAAFVFIAARRATRSVPLAVAAGLLFASYPPAVLNANQVMSDVLFMLLFTPAVFLCASNDAAGRPPVSVLLAAGLLLGFATLTRPVSMWFFVPVSLFLLLVRGVRPAAVVLFVIASIAAPLGWAARNYRATRVFTVSSLAGEHLYLFNGSAALIGARNGVLYSLTALHTQSDFYYQLWHLMPAQARKGDRRIAAEIGNAAETTLLDARRSRYYARFGREIIREHPLGFAATTAGSLSAMVLDPLWVTAADFGINYWRVKPGLMLLSLYVFIAAVAGVPTLYRLHPPLAIMIVLAVVYLAMLSSNAADDTRMTIPMAPFYSVAVAAGLTRMARQRPNR